MAKSSQKLTHPELKGTSWLGRSAAYVEDLFRKYQENPTSVDNAWQEIFTKLNQGSSWSELSHETPAIRRYLPHSTNLDRIPLEQAASKKDMTLLSSLLSLIESFRTYGHLQAQLDPLELTLPNSIPELTLEYHGIHPTEKVNVSDFPVLESLNLSGSVEIETVFRRLRALYCEKIGYEYQYILSSEERNWLKETIEHTSQKDLQPEEKKRILYRLLESEGLEKHLGTQFIAQKRFSIEGADALMPMLHELALESTQKSVTSIVFGMAHRARLNMLVNLLGKEGKVLSKEFSGEYSDEDTLTGDVKYHKGFVSQLNTPHGILDVELAFNPSHLEVVNSIVEGITRAKQDNMERLGHSKNSVLPVLIHGDAAFAGQGIVMETLQLSQTPAYSTQGTVHIILNNQVGFTTSPEQARSSRYASDIAKMIEAPVFHINGSDPEAACWAMKLAFDYRMKFKKDAVIDLICYRRYGHNEADEPAATQPLMYQKIRSMKPVWFYYDQKLQAEQVTKAGEAEDWLKDYRKRIAIGETVAALATSEASYMKEESSEKNDWRQEVKTSVPLKQLKSFETDLTQLPDGMVLQPQVAKLMVDRQKMIQGTLPLNWGTAETLAYRTLLDEGYTIRLSGQDTERGTFAHRHAVLHDYKTNAAYTPLVNCIQYPKQFSIYDSILSEMATMGFEYGYAYEKKQALVIWEAQYGDFVNGAQIVIDQFLTASEQKWGQRSNLVLFLPHGYEGSGPEHSSARLERFLQQCGQENIQVCIPTTPAQHFHLLRRQVKRIDWPKPLIVMTPKSLLRHKQATSELSALSEHAFQTVLVPVVKDKKNIQKLVFCSGKIYYDLIAKEHTNSQATLIIRIEQLYPFPDKELHTILKDYATVTDVIWCQEEPQNQGAWQWIQPKLAECLTVKQNLKYVGRPEAAATAVGSPLRHASEQQKLISEVFK